MFINWKKIDCTISNEKFWFCIFNLKIVDFVCDFNDKSFEIVKIIKILKWSSYCDIFEFRAFINVCV